MLRFLFGFLDLRASFISLLFIGRIRGIRSLSPITISLIRYNHKCLGISKEEDLTRISIVLTIVRTKTNVIIISVCNEFKE